MKPAAYFAWLEEHPPTEVNGVQYCLSLYSLCEGVRAKSVLEIGQGWGWSSTALCASVSERGGKVVSLDPVDRMRPECREFVAGSHESIPLSSFEYEPQGMFDLIYMDGDPRLDTIQQDYARYYEHLSPGGLLIVDGYFGQGGPTDFWKDCGLEFVPLQYSEYYAHAVHRKKPWNVMTPVVVVACNNCAWATADGTEVMLAEKARAHSEENHHHVISNQIGTTGGGMKIVRQWKPAKEVA